jgi:Mg/Co/Ni transporter MgtE
MGQAALESMFRAYVAEHPNDAARALEALPPRDAAPLLRGLPHRLSGPVMERLAPDAAAAPLTTLGRDPAQASSIFLTTVTDIVGFASFLGFAALLLPALG